MSDLPASVEFHEEGPREGFQMEQQTYPLADRAALIDALAASGLKQIQVASFVSPRAVPQMADTSELFAAIAKRPGTRYTALWLNDNGFERARACEQVDLDGKLMFYTTEPFSQRNNNCSVAEMRERQLGWLDRYIALGIPVEKAYVITAFGCNLGGAVPLSAVTDQVRWLVDACAIGVCRCQRCTWPTPWVGPTPKTSSAASARCARSFRIPALDCICTTRAVSAVPTSMPRCKWGCDCSIARSPAWAAVPLPGTSRAAPPATFVLRTWCSCVMNSGSRPVSISMP